MRHARNRHKLGRSASHRKATLGALSVALIRHKRITTTLPKAKALRVYVEPLITRARIDTTHNRREVFRHLMDKHAVKELFGEIAVRVGSRPGGYTRVLRLGQRQGDAAEMALIELVDYNESVSEERPSRRRTRRGRRGRRSGTRTEDSVSVRDISGQEEAESPRVEDTEVEGIAADTEDIAGSDAAVVESGENVEPVSEDAAVLESEENVDPVSEDAAVLESGENAEPVSEDAAVMKPEENAEPVSEDAAVVESEFEDTETDVDSKSGSRERHD